MKKPSNKQAKKASKLAKAENLKKKANKFITVKNAEGDPDTTAEIVIQNKINYEPKVSVIIPVYNVEQYLRECLDSVVNQTLKEIEIICVDDGSTDSSLEILKEYAEKDNRITVMKQTNLHAGVARNAGLAVARGEYLSFLDSDDWFELNMLEESYKKACEQNADIVIFNWTVVDEIKNKRLLSTDGVPFFVKEKLKYDVNYNFAQEISNNLFFISNPAPWNKLYKRDFILESSIRFQNLTCCNDIGFNTSALALSKKINIINKNFAYYRKHATNTSNTKSEEKSDNIIKAGYYILNNIKNNGLYNKLEDAFYRGISVSFYWEYCRTTDLTNQTNKYKQFLPEKYYNEFRAKFEGTRKRKIILVGSDNICDTTGGAITVFWERASLFANIGFNVTCVFDNKNKTEKVFNHDPKLKLVNINTYNDDKLCICEKFNILLQNEKPDLLIFFFPSMVHKYTKDIDISPYNSLLMLHSRPDVYFERDNIDGVIKSCNKIKYAQVLMPSFIPILKKYIKNQKIEIIPNYIDEPIIKEKIESYNKFIFYSRCDCGKNIPLLVNAFKIVHDKYPNWILDIYGQSEPESYMQKVSKLINLLNLTDYINYIPKSQIGRDVLNNADIFVFPSYFEGQGLGLCEGLSYGLPAIVLDKCSAVNEIVKDKYNGLYAKDCPIDFAEKMIQLIENVELRQKMSKNAIKSVEQYNKAAINGLWIKFVCNIINKTFEEVNISNIEKKDIYDISYIHSKWDDFNPYTEAPEISVITSSYNTVQYIDECLDSILNQTFKNIEVICIDDHSTDGTYEKLLSYQEKDQRIKVFRNIKNMKLGWCRNFGINKARGDYIFFCDSDDFIKENTFELLYNNIKNNDAELCLYLLSIYNNDSKKIIDLENQNFDRIKKLNKNVFNWKDYPKSVFERVEAVLKLYKRDFLINNNIKFFEGCYFEDTIVHIKSISLAKKICFTDEKLYMYRKNREGQITGNSNNTEKFLDIFNYINEAENFFKENKIWRKIKNEYLWFAIERICGYYNRCDVLTRVSFSKKARDWLKNKDINEIRKNAGNLFPTFCKITNLTKSPSILKSYLLLPYYLLKIQHIRLKIEKYSHIKCEKVNSLPNINANVFISLGNACKPAYWIKKHNLRKVALPFDWMMGYKLEAFLKTFKNGCDNWFDSYIEHEAPNCAHRYVVDTANNITDMHHFSKTKLVKEQLPSFKETFKRRGKRLQELLKTNDNICFLCNRSENFSEIRNFLDELEKLYPNTNFTLINVLHSETKKVEKYILSKKSIVYFVYDYDIHEKGGTPENPSFWIGNEKLWNGICSHLSISKSKPSRVFSIRDYGEKVVYRILGFKLSLKKQKLKFLYDKVKTDTYTKTYICGICVKKKPANVFNFIDSRVCNLSNQLSREINKQTQLIENKLKLIENKQIDLANNIKKEIDNIASLQNNLEAKVKEDILSVSEANLFELNKINEEISTNKEKLVALEDLIIGASQQINDTINSTEGFLADKIINLEEISANKEKLVALEDLISETSQHINDAIVSSVTANSDNIAKLQSVLRSSGSDIASEISALYKEHSSQLQSVKEQSISNRADIVAKLENNANEIQGLKEQAQSNRTDIVAKLDEFDANINDAKKDIIDKCQDLNCSEMLRNLKEQAQSNRTDIVAKLENNNNSISEFRKDILNKYQELNYADLLHDSIVNSSWLKDKTFSLFGWAANYSFIYTLFRILDKASPKNILEMGLGQTTRLTSQYVAFGNNDAKLNVCEHDQNWIDIYRNELPKSDNIQLNHFELEYFDFDGKQNDKYKDMPKVVGDKKFDLIIVDGPVGGGKNLPRSNVIDLIPNNLAEDFVIIIDDTERDGEQRTIRKIKEKLNECNIKYSISERRALKGQTLITSVSRDFVKFL